MSVFYKSSKVHFYMTSMYYVCTALPYQPNFACYIAKPLCLSSACSTISNFLALVPQWLLVFIPHRTIRTYGLA